MSKHATEARLLKALAVEIEELETLEKFQLGEALASVYSGKKPLLRGVHVLFETPFAHNPVEVRERMQAAIAQTIAETAPDLVANAVAVQRGIVEQKRQELADFQTKPLPVAIDENGLDVDDAKGFAGNGEDRPETQALTRNAVEEADVDF
jgi:hypothetical protein